jgi:hypothetical protein
MVIALAGLLVSLFMLLIYVLLRNEERQLEAPKHGVPPSRPDSKNN